MKNNKYILYVMLLLIPHEQFIASAGAGRSVALQGNEVAIESMAVDEKYLAPNADLVDDLQEYYGRCSRNYLDLKFDERDHENQYLVCPIFILRNSLIEINHNNLGEEDNAVYPNITATTYLNLLIKSLKLNSYNDRVNACNGINRSINFSGTFSGTFNIKLIEFCIKKYADLTWTLEHFDSIMPIIDRIGNNRDLKNIKILLERGQAWQEANPQAVLF